MDRKQLLTLAALSATFAFPMSGAFADSNDASPSASGLTNTIMDAGRFRDSLHNLRDLLSQIQENRNLALAAQDSLVASQYEETNSRLLNESLGLLDTITRNWKSAEIAPAPNETAEMRSNRSIDRLGTADAVRFANESEDTAFVRNTVWDIQSQLQADKLNGRDPVVRGPLMSELDAAIARAENPTFRVVKAFDQSKLASIQWPERKEFVWDRSHDMVAQAPPPSSTTRTEESTTPPAPATAENTTTTQRTEVAQATPAPSTSEETTTTETTDRSGAANLPKTGGDPGSLFFMGSSFIGLGAFLRRRR